MPSDVASLALTDRGLSREPLLDRPTVTVEGYKFERWTRLSISRSLDQTAASFSCSLGPLQSYATSPDPIEAFSPGKVVVIHYGRQRMLKGIVDTHTISSSSTGESLDIDGRDLGGLLVDSSMDLTFDNTQKSIEEVARDVVQRFTGHFEGSRRPLFTAVQIEDRIREYIQDRARELGKKLLGASKGRSRPNTQVTPQPGQTWDQYLRRLGTDQDLDVWVEPDGSLKIGDRSEQRTRTDAPAVLALLTYRGENASLNNFKDTQVIRSIVGRHSEYTAYTYVQENEDDVRVGRWVKGVEDDFPPLFKPLYTPEIEVHTPSELENTVISRLSQATADSVSITGTAVGWGQRVGQKDHFFEPNSLVKVDHEVAGIRNELFYITSVDYTHNEGEGPQSALSLSPLDSPTTISHGGERQ